MGIHRIIHKFASKQKNILINLKTNGMKLILGRLLIALLLAAPASVAGHVSSTFTPSKDGTDPSNNSFSYTLEFAKIEDKIHGDNPEDRPRKRDLGSYDVLPSAYITDAGLTLKGTVTLEGLQVRIENEEETVVYSSIMNIGRGEAQVIPLSHLPHGNYSLFLTIDEDEYVATFALEE